MKISESTKTERVSKSSLGVYINLVTNDDPLLMVCSKRLAKQISLEFNVLCTKEDIEEFYGLDDLDDYKYEEYGI